jgi:ABC-type transporter Mla maintaining outer membrane lipid asymmetry permease subunit MlaE
LKFRKDYTTLGLLLWCIACLCFFCGAFLICMFKNNLSDESWHEALINHIKTEKKEKSKK